MAMRKRRRNQLPSVYKRSNKLVLLFLIVVSCREHIIDGQTLSSSSESIPTNQQNQWPLMSDNEEDDSGSSSGEMMILDDNEDIRFNFYSTADIWSKSQVLHNTDGSVYNPMNSLNGYVIFFNCICLIVGLFASVKVIHKVVVNCRENGWRPRHILVMGNIISCILTLLIHCLVPCVYYCWPRVVICQFMVIVYRLPYIHFLFNLLVSLIERYVAVTRSVWHRTKFNIRYCIAWLLIMGLLLAMIMKWSFISQKVTIECSFHFLHVLTVVVTILILFVLCTVFLVVVFVITWRQLPRAARAIPIPFSPSDTVSSDDHIIPALFVAALQLQDEPINLQADIEYVSMRDLLLPSAAVVPLDEEEKNPLPPTATTAPIKNHKIRPIIDPSSSYTLRQMELQVTKHFLFTLLPLFVAVIPCLIFGFNIIVHSFFVRNEDSDSNSNVVSYLPYVSLLPTIHVVIYPLANLFLNKDICSFSFSFCRCLFPGCICCTDDDGHTTTAAGHHYQPPNRVSAPVESESDRNKRLFN